MLLKTLNHFLKGFHKLIVIAIVVCGASASIAQNSNLNWEYQRFFVDTFYQNSSEFEFNFEFQRNDTLIPASKSKVVDYLFNKHRIHHAGKDYVVNLNEILELGYGSKQSDNNRVLRLSKGLCLSFLYKDKLEVSSSIYNGFEKPEAFLSDWSKENLVYPGFGGVKLNTGFFDYLSGFGYLNWRASKYFRLVAGHGKNKIGEGYRSLFLSDAVHNYPFVKAQFSIWRFNHSIILAQFTRFDEPLNSSGLRRKKGGVFHHLEGRVTDNLKFSFFEAVIWAQDSLGIRGFELNYINPFVAIRPIEYAIGSPDNMLLGLGFKWTPWGAAKLYGQFIMDEFKISELRANNGWWASKYGWQFGVDIRNLFGIKYLNWINEFNSVRPFTYSHFDVTQNYGHLQQSLAHPAGANFNEFVSILSYRKNRWLGSCQFNYKYQGLELNDEISLGSDINRSYELRWSDYGNEIGQGYSFDQYYLDLKGGYLLNPKTNLIIELELIHRSRHFSDVHLKETQFLLGLRTSLFNIYRDF